MTDKSTSPKSTSPKAASTNSAAIDPMTVYAAGQAAFERGQYREATEWLQKALNITSAQSPLGGAIQIWQVMAYDAAGQRDLALEICRKLNTHGDRETRQQSKRLLYILEAPKLQMRSEWLTQIPDLSQPSASISDHNHTVGQTRSSSLKSRRPDQPQLKDPFEPIDLKENGGFWVLALGVSLAVLVALGWFSQNP